MFACLISMLDCEKGIIWKHDIVGAGRGDGGSQLARLFLIPEGYMGEGED